MTELEQLLQRLLAEQPVYRLDPQKLSHRALLNMPLVGVNELQSFGREVALRQRHDDSLNRLFHWSERNLDNKLFYRRLLPMLQPAHSELQQFFRDQGLDPAQASSAAAGNISEPFTTTRMVRNSASATTGIHRQGSPGGQGGLGSVAGGGDVGGGAYSAGMDYYLLVYFMFDGNIAEGAVWKGVLSMAYAALGFATVPWLVRLSSRCGKVRALALIYWLTAVGGGLKWFIFTPGSGWWLLLASLVLEASWQAERHAHGDRQVKATRLLGQVCRRQVDRDALIEGKRQPAIAQGRAHTLTRLLDLGVGQPHQGERGQAVGQVHLDRHTRRMQPIQGATVNNR